MKNSTYLKLRESVTGRQIDSMRIELNDYTTKLIKNLGRRNGYDVNVVLDCYYTSTYNKKLWDNLKRFYEVGFVTGE